MSKSFKISRGGSYSVASVSASGVEGAKSNSVEVEGMTFSAITWSVAYRGVGGILVTFVASGVLDDTVEYDFRLDGLGGLISPSTVTSTVKNGFNELFFEGINVGGFGPYVSEEQPLYMEDKGALSFTHIVGNAKLVANSLTLSGVYDYDTGEVNIHVLGAENAFELMRYMLTLNSTESQIVVRQGGRNIANLKIAPSTTELKIARVDFASTAAIPWAFEASYIPTSEDERSLYTGLYKAAFGGAISGTSTIVNVLDAPSIRYNPQTKEIEWDEVEHAKSYVVYLNGVAIGKVT